MDMYEDIVALCRELQADEKQLGNDLLAQCLWDAANEIERLQAELVQANNAIKLLIAIETA